PQNFSGELTTVTWTVQNFGAAVRPDTHFWTDQIFFSPDPTFIPSRAIHLSDVVHVNDSASGGLGTYTATAQVILPRGIGGTYYVHVIADAGGTLRADASLGNDGSRAYFGSHGYEDGSNNLTTAAIAVTYREADLQVTSVVLPAGTPNSGANIAV